MDLTITPVEMLEHESFGGYATACVWCGCLVHGWTRHGTLLAIGDHNIAWHPTEPGSKFDGH